MNRETKTVKTSGGHTIEFYSFINGKESREIQGTFMDSTEIQSNGDSKEEPKISFKANAVLKMQDMAVRMLTVSVNGNKDNPVDLLEALPAADYNDYIAALNPIVEPVFFAKGGFIVGSATPAKN